MILFLDLMLSYRSKLIDMRTKELQALKKTNQTEKAEVIIELVEL